MHRAALVAALLLTGCDDNVWGQSAADSVEAPSQTGYAGVQEVAAGYCIACHNATGLQGGLDLETDLAAASVGVIGAYGLPIVAAGDPTVSMLYLKMSNTQPENTGTDMPPGSGGLDPVLTDVVEQWILDGAPAQ